MAISCLRPLLRPHLEEDYEILDYYTKPLTAVGDNYGSTMLALSVKLRHEGSYKEKTLEMVAKMVPENPVFFQMFQVQLSFPKESSMYTTVADTLAKHQDEYQVPADLRMNAFCKSFGTRRNLNSAEIVDTDAVLLLDNLKVQGFGCGSRMEGFNKKDTEYVLKNLARFHGVPIAVRFLKSEVFEKEIMPSLRKIDMRDGMPESMFMEFFKVRI